MLKPKHIKRYMYIVIGCSNCKKAKQTVTDKYVIGYYVFIDLGIGVSQACFHLNTFMSTRFEKAPSQHSIGVNMKLTTKNDIVHYRRCTEN